ncbi:MAG: non-heme iron oxygenase ferredoxin subunit [Gemmatimonadetes bacterium]|nr:non-heme iron oxygenase ferredoxin subunit [Gemmatimonadota bacterium]
MSGSVEGGADVTQWVRVATLDELPPGAMFGVEVDGQPVCLANADGQVYALADNCTHEDFPLHNGELDGTELECALHGACFDITTGRAIRLPAVKPVRTFRVKIEGDDIFVAL